MFYSYSVPRPPYLSYVVLFDSPQAIARANPVPRLASLRVAGVYRRLTVVAICAVGHRACFSYGVVGRATRSAPLGCCDSVCSTSIGACENKCIQRRGLRCLRLAWWLLVPPPAASPSRGRAAPA